MYRVVFRRYNSTANTLFRYFPETCPKPTFNIDLRKLRKEYRRAQSLAHPDVDTSSGTTSAEINRAYETLSDPLKRAQHLLLVEAGIDLTNDEVGKKLQFQDKDLLLEIMDVHERLETGTENEQLKIENDAKISHLIDELKVAFENKDWDKLALLTVRLKYCYNVKDLLKNNTIVH